MGHGTHLCKTVKAPTHHFDVRTYSNEAVDVDLKFVPISRAKLSSSPIMAGQLLKGDLLAARIRGV
jgi:hypothetical protein